MSRIDLVDTMNRVQWYRLEARKGKKGKKKKFNKMSFEWWNVFIDSAGSTDFNVLDPFWGRNKFRSDDFNLFLTELLI